MFNQDDTRRTLNYVLRSGQHHYIKKLHELQLLFANNKVAQRKLYNASR
jgi:hypothetical protein